MAANTVDVAGHTPLSFTDSSGAQRFVPLSAFEFVGSDIQLKTAWATEFNNADQQILLAIAGARAAGGELVPPPVTPPAPAVTFTAAVAGTEGSGITVGVTPDPGSTTVLDAKAEITAQETDVYSSLVDATAAGQMIGVDVPGGSFVDAPVGTGLVRLKASQSPGDGLPKDGQSLTVKAAGANVLAADGSATLFTLVPRPGAPSGGVAVTVAVDSVAGTFTLTATFDAGSQPQIDLTDLDSLPAPVAFLVEASAPPGGLRIPTAGDVQLTGGSPGIAATGIAYTS
jgi:hypothetical protein